MGLTRRRLFAIVVAAAGAAGTAYAAGPGHVRAWLHRLVTPSLGNAPVGPINSETVKALLAATEALIDYPLKTEHYADFFRWRSEHLPGHRALYEQFAATVSHAARSRGCDFAACDTATRRKILEPASQVRTPRGRFGRLSVDLREPDWVLFELHIVRPVKRQFARTDAWRAAGYDGWPGTPRGLENYTRGPSALGVLRPRSSRLPGAAG